MWRAGTRKHANEYKTRAASTLYTPITRVTFLLPLVVVFIVARRRVELRDRRRRRRILLVVRKIDTDTIIIIIFHTLPPAAAGSLSKRHNNKIPHGPRVHYHRTATKIRFPRTRRHLLTSSWTGFNTDRRVRLDLLGIAVTTTAGGGGLSIIPENIFFFPLFQDL